MTDLRIGVIARAEDRGLGIQTWEVCRHLQPDRVLLIDPGPLAGNFAQHTDRYAKASNGGELKATVDVSRWEAGTLDEAKVRAFLKAVDVVYTAETFYDWRIPEWAAELGTGVVCHVNPELLNDNVRTLPVRWWAATDWRLDTLPADTRVVPMPVATDRFPEYQPDRGLPVRFLHVMGHRAAYDRNGTIQVMRATRYMRERAVLQVRGQDSVLPIETKPGPYVSIELEPEGVSNYWRLYGDADVLVMPRRYGGLCLPVQEAAAAGLALVLTDCDPNRTWPGVHVPARLLREVELPGGTVPLFEVHDGTLAQVLDDLAADLPRVRSLQEQSLSWARAHSWAALTPLWRAELADAAR